jgi:tetratricopeptide (TPR) repeat protein
LGGPAVNMITRKAQLSHGRYPVATPFILPTLYLTAGFITPRISLKMLTMSSHNKDAEDNNNNSVEHLTQGWAADQMATLPDPSPEQIQVAVHYKEQGNASFSNKDWSKALQYYSQAIDANPKEAALYSNRSACYIHLQQPPQALTDALLAQTLRPQWSKAYYRLATARLELQHYSMAALAAWEGLHYDPQNSELKRLLQTCVQRGREEHLFSKRQGATTTSTATAGTTTAL